MSYTLPRLTSLSTQTLTLLLERQRLQSLAGSELSVSLPSSSLAQITRNLGQLRTGIYGFEGQNGNPDAVRALRDQYDRMRDMLGVDKDQIEALKPQEIDTSKDEYLPDVDPMTAPYKDDPDAARPYADIDSSTPFDSAEVLESQRLMMHEQDTRLDVLHSSLTRQHSISQELSSELDVQAGLLTELDTDLDRTASRLGRARRTLDKVGRGLGANGSTVAIAVVILVLLILIVVFKT
ncbi:syntaxin-like protein [Hysterangium stoloniferum]|nr:syntaxin-like protein [Hysterangium stoloniferum]